MVRRAWLAAQPEEYVRQGLIEWFLERGCPAAWMQVERKVGSSRDRLDLLVLDRRGQPYVLAEAKAPGFNLNPAIQQLARYNRVWRAPFALAVNGEDALCCALDYSTQQIDLLAELPPYPS